MMPRHSPRFRIFLVFAALALALIAGLQVMLRMGAMRVLDLGLDAGIAFLGVAGTAGILLLSLCAWLYCDERIAKPLAGRDDLSDDAGGPVPGQADPVGSGSVTTDHEAALRQEAGDLSRNLAKLDRDKAQLSRLLSEIPVAVILINAADRIVFYEGEAAALLERTASPRLNARLSEYLDADLLAGARDRMQRTGREVCFAATSGAGGSRMEACMRPMEDGGALVILKGSARRDASTLPGPLVYDFDLMATNGTRPIAEMPLSALTFVVLSTDTTGLLPHRDEVVQIGAVRMMGDRILRHETLDLRINPGLPGRRTAISAGKDRPEPARHDILTASAQLHDFSRDAVIVAHNTPLRMAFLRRHDAATGLKWDHPQIDLVLLSALLFGERADHSLRALAGRTGTPLPTGQAKGALAQALVAADVLQRLMQMMAGRGINSLGPMMTALDRHAERLENLR
jgi:DNA polymerase-3 subunit epsilon